MEENDNIYLNEILKKYDYIQAIWISDNEGGMVASQLRNEENSESSKIKTSFSLLFPSTIEQISRSEKWKTKNLITIYDTLTVFQSKVNKNILVHVLCDSKTFNYELTKEIVNEIQEKLSKVEWDIENITQNEQIENSNK
jgi:hypothetical protein